jgi:Fe-S-cluster-containing dehydrogenase component
MGRRMMEKVHIVVDLAKCVGCFNCLIACKDEHVGNSWLPYTDSQQKHGEKWINPHKFERGKAPFTEVFHLPKFCQHCGEAPCQKACPDSVLRREDGVVLLDAEKAKGNRALAGACPFGMISWNEELKTAQKCTLCAHLLDAGWKEPRCVQACPLRALSLVRCEDEKFAELAEAQLLKPLYEVGQTPRVLYRNLYKYTTCFISGSFAYVRDGIERAAAGAAVRLKLGGEVLKEVRTDFFGDFKIDRIPKNSGLFSIEGSLPGYKPVERSVTVGDDSPCLEVLRFER